MITNPGNGETFKVEIQDIKAIVDREFDQKNDLNENVYGQKVILRYNATLNDKAAEDTGRDLKMMYVSNFQIIQTMMGMEQQDILRGIRLSASRINSIF